MASKKQSNNVFNSAVNVLGGVPDYATMIQYALDKIEGKENSEFSFRTEKSGQRFIAAINQELLVFKNEQHKSLIVDALSSNDLRLDQKLMVLFWQLLINNKLFSLITENYFMKCVYAGRISLFPNEIESYLYELRREYPEELQWSDATLKTTASKYLTMMKKLGLAEGNQQKHIRYPNIGDDLFIFLVKLALAVFPKENTEANWLFKFSFLDTNSLINRFKAVRFTPLWTIKQIGNNIQIELT